MENEENTNEEVSEVKGTEGQSVPKDVEMPQSGSYPAGYDTIQQQNGYQQNDNYQNGYQQNGYQQNDNYQNGYYQNGYQQTQMPQGPKPGANAATGSLICGICSIVFCNCYGLPGIILGIIAIVQGNKAISLNGGIPDGTAKGGKICGIIGLVLGILYLVVCIFALFFGIAVGFYENMPSSHI